MDELLSDILAVEREVRERIAALKEESANRLAALTQRFDHEFALESGRLKGELSRALEMTEHAAHKEGDTLLAEAVAFAQRTDRFSDEELVQVIGRHLRRLRPKEDHDRQDVQT